MNIYERALIEGIARAAYENRVSLVESDTERQGWPSWDRHEKGDADEWRDMARAALPLVRKSQADAIRGLADELDRKPLPSRHGLPAMLRADWLRARADKIQQGDA